LGKVRQQTFLLHLVVGVGQLVVEDLVEVEAEAGLLLELVVVFSAKLAVVVFVGLACYYFLLFPDFL